MSSSTATAPIGPSAARRDSNRWLRQRAGSIGGVVLSVGSGDDADGEGSRYRAYFAAASRYITSEREPTPNCDLVLDVCDMHAISSSSVDAIFCSGVLEHVSNPWKAVTELARVLRSGGTLLLGLPFRQAIHLAPTDYWRFTEFGIRELLAGHFRVDEIYAIDTAVADFPAAYWTRAVRS